MPSDPIPAQAWERIKDFLSEHKTGSITLDVKQGVVLSWRMTEYGSIQKEKQ
jgi:hypothetical protein